jgi:hypothetical protein
MTIIKQSIAGQIRQSQELETSLQAIRDMLNQQPIGDIRAYTSLLELIQRYPANEKLLEVFLEFLQLANSAEIIDQYELNDIDILFNELCKLHPLHYTLHLEYYFYLFNVLDREDAARTFLQTYVQSMTSNLNEMNKLLTQ